jgi:hypothetical protein
VRRGDLGDVSGTVMRNPFSVEKMAYVPETDPLLYRSEMKHGRNKHNFEVYDGHEFTAAITQYIPHYLRLNFFDRFWDDTYPYVCCDDPDCRSKALSVNYLMTKEPS